MLDRYRITMLALASSGSMVLRARTASEAISSHEDGQGILRRSPDHWRRSHSRVAIQDNFTQGFCSHVRFIGYKTEPFTLGISPGNSEEETMEKLSERQPYIKFAANYGSLLDNWRKLRTSDGPGSSGVSSGTFDILDS